MNPDSPFDFYRWPRSYVDAFAPVPTGNPLFSVFWFALYGGTLFVLYRRILRPERLSIQFYITDIWAMMLALVPAFTLLSVLSDNGERTLSVAEIALVAITLSSTLAGSWAWLMLALPFHNEPMPSRWSHFVSVLGGGFVGFFGIFVVALLFDLVLPLCVSLKYLPLAIYYVVYCWFQLCLAMPPLFVMTAVGIYFAKRAYDLWAS